MLHQLILTSSFSTVADELREKGILPLKPLRVAFVPTAANCYSEKPWMEVDRNALIRLGYAVYDVDIAEMNAEMLKREFTNSDVIFVAGGNTTFLAEKAHMSGFSAIIHELLAEGRLYVGSSAGSILAGPTVEPFLEEELQELPKDFTLHDSRGLGLVPFVVLPHALQYEESNNKVRAAFGDRYTFVLLTDNEFRIESM